MPRKSVANKHKDNLLILATNAHGKEKKGKKKKKI